MKPLYLILFYTLCSLMLFVDVQAQSASVDSANTEIHAVDVERRARKIGQSLRCVVCQNQSIDESDADLARDMRRLVRNQIAEGKSDAEIVSFMQERYGDYVLLKPPLQKNTYILWFTPFALLILALAWYFGFARKVSSIEGASRALTAEEQARLRQLEQETHP